MPLALSKEIIVARYTNKAAMAVLISLILRTLSAAAQEPEAIAAPGAARLLEVHAEGAQIYECKPGKDGKLAWQFREPIATLILDGKTIGRHYIGPTWELLDGSAVTGKVTARAPGATAKDIPWLKLEVSSRGGSGQLSGAATIQRLDTKGGAMDGDCAESGVLVSVPYSSNYAFLK
jgi:Protein of unknown function (DUF3455)